MEKQLQANSIRISVLEQENVRLRSALAKVKAAAEQGVLKVRLHPSQGELGAAGERGARASRVLRTPRPPPGTVPHPLWTGSLVAYPCRRGSREQKAVGLLAQHPLRLGSCFPSLHGAELDKAASRRA